jgi:protein-L-isoaspartate(D-aspartate) O-methyltransferase
VRHLVSTVDTDTDRRVEEALHAAPRKAYLPRDQRRYARLDRALPIGWRQTNSQPTTVRNMLTLLDPQPGDRVLDVGSGSGWTAALLAHLVGPTGRVIGVEVVPELVEFARHNLEAQHVAARVEQAVDGVLGLPDEAPFDRILVSAGAQALPLSLVDQLVVGGVMVVPVAGWMHEVRRTEGEPYVARHGTYSFVPLVGG